MTEYPNIRALIDAGREEEAVALLMDGIRLPAATGARSVRAALEAALRLYHGNLKSTALFMNRPRSWLCGQTPLESAEESEAGLQVVIDRIMALDDVVNS